MTEIFWQIYLPAAVGLTVIYALIIATYRKGWKALPHFDIPKNYQAQTKITVIIPARNEEKNIGECLQSVLNQSLSPDLYEVVVIDDHSADDTAKIIRSFPADRVKLLSLADYVSEKDTQSFKKKAIEIAVAQAAGELIVTTDADCLVPENWLQLYAAFYETQKIKFIAAPVTFHREKNSLQRFQTLDFHGMMCVTGAGIHTGLMHMCNGANMAYEKAAFYAVNGFAGIDNIASGDDMLLLQKIAAEYPGRIGFLKNINATVHTEAKPDLTSFFAQRLRWATKSTSYSETRVTLILAAVFFHCCSIVFSFFLIPFFGKIALQLFVFQILIKSVADYIYLRMMSIWFDKKDAMRWFLSSEILHILYIVIVGTAGNFVKKYEWKGRRVE